MPKDEVMSSTGNAPRILVVEDDWDTGQLICESLRLHYGEGAGQRVVTAANGAECLAQDLGAFDIVLADLHLPDMSGMKLLEQIHAQADLPVIFVTSENDSATAVDAIRRGAADYVVKLGDYLFVLPTLVDKNIRQHQLKRENERLQRELETRNSELRVKNIQLEESLDKLRMMATTDHLTGLANRRRFGELLERHYSEAVRYGFDLTCCMCDLDHYKQLNDTLGHQVGDEVLVIAADVVRSSLRTSDIAARYGGDEVVLLLPHTSVQRGLAVGERIREELVRRTRKHAKLAHEVTLSIGVASLEVDRPTSADVLVAMADRALYVAKDRGKDRIVAFNRIRDTAPAAQ